MCSARACSFSVPLPLGPDLTTCGGNYCAHCHHEQQRRTHAWLRTLAARMLLLTRDAAADRLHPAGIRRESSRACMQLCAPRLALCSTPSFVHVGPLRLRGPPLPALPSRACYAC
jgi:hypothetical protein